MSTRTLGALAVTALCAFVSPALADDAAQETGAVTIDARASGPRVSETRRRSRVGGVGNLRIHAGMHFALGGELDVDPERGIDYEEDLDPTIGMQTGVDYVIMDYFALGGELRLSWWRPEENLIPFEPDPDRSLFVDINVKPRGRYAFASVPLEVYGTLPMGLSIAAINDIPIEGGVGFNLGFGGGATYFFHEHVGVNMELLGVWHWFDGDLEIATRDIDTDNRTGQFYWLINGVFAI